ncbi:hypothetical protein FHG87_013242 [Trinorchestia longiramus]|nr:hypothetical protein FHG87_013242 [Trinorchestia longiramus]
MSTLSLSSDRERLLALMMSLSRENKRSTAAVVGIAVLYLKKRFIFLPCRKRVVHTLTSKSTEETIAC